MDIICKHFNICGACQFQNIPYQEQLNTKSAALKERFAQLDSFIDASNGFEVAGMENPWRYRNKMECAFSTTKDKKIIIGFHKKGSFHKIVDIEECLLVPSIFEGILKKTKDIVNKMAVTTYHPKTHRGFWRHIILRYGQYKNEVMLICVTNEGDKGPVCELTGELTKEFSHIIKSIYWGVTSKVADVAISERLDLLYGEPCISEKIGDTILRIYPTNFIQPNIEQARKIYGRIKEIAGAASDLSNRCCYDLYCGIGVIAMTIASLYGRVVGIDSDFNNILCAKENAKITQNTNIDFLHAKAEDLSWASQRLKAPMPDTVILDPPRAGIHKNALPHIARTLPNKIVYLSCNPDTIARDLKFILKNYGYKISFLKGWDMFPHTSHIETLALLERG